MKTNEKLYFCFCAVIILAYAVINVLNWQLSQKRKERIYQENLAEFHRQADDLKSIVDFINIDYQITKYGCIEKGITLDENNDLCDSLTFTEAMNRRVMHYQKEGTFKQMEDGLDSMALACRRIKENAPHDKADEAKECEGELNAFKQDIASTENPSDY